MWEGLSLVDAPTAGRLVRARLIRAIVAAVFAVAAVLPLGAVVAPAAEAVAPRLDPRVVIVVGPVGSFNAHYKADADALARVARQYTRNVVVIKTPKATWSRVRAAAQGASIFIYLGHGNGWPSRYRDGLWPFSQNGLGLDPDSGANGSAHVYYGENQVASDIRFAPNAVVLLFHLCYASGNTEPGLPTGSLADKKARADNYGAGFFAAGARTVIADAYHPQVTYLTRLFTATTDMNRLFHIAPSYHRHDIAFDSFRTTGAKVVMDPTSVTRGPYYHSIVYDPALTARMVTRTAYRPTNTVPAALVVPGAATTGGAVDLSADALLTTAAGSLAAGVRLRVVAEAPALADGTRVIEVRTLDGTSTGFIRATAIEPADSTPASLYDYDPPGTLIGPNGDYVFDTFHVIVRASEPLDGTVTVRDAAGAAVKTLTATDAWSVFDWNLRGADGTVVPDGHYTWSYSGTEPWGNNAAPFTRSGAFDLDATDPATTAATAGTLHPTGWYTTAATVTLAGRDAASGLRATYYRLDGGKKTRWTGPIPIATSGDHQLAYWSVDRAGNVESTRTLEVKVDVSAPITRAALAGPVGEVGFYRDDVTVGLDATDGQSGVAATEIAVDGAPIAPYSGPVVVGGDGAHQVSFRSTDRTGRREAIRTVGFTIDREAPLIGPAGAVTVGAGQFSPNGDGLADTVTVSHAVSEPGAVRLVVTPSGGGSAVRSATFPVAAAGLGTISWDGRTDAGGYAPDGDYTLSLTALDRSRNVGSSQTVEVTVFGAFIGLAAAPIRFYPQDADAITPRTAARFSLTAAADVNLTVLDPAGIPVRTITGTYPAGPVAIAWDGRADSGVFVPQGAYRMVVRATVGGRSETHLVGVRAAAFEIRPSLTSIRRGMRLTVTVVTSERLRTPPRLTVRQPGLVVYAVRLTKVGPTTYRASWLLRRGGQAGQLAIVVAATDSAGGRNATRLNLRVR